MINKSLLLVLGLFISFSNPSYNSDNSLQSTEQDMLLGEFEPEKLQEKPYSTWFTPAFESYKPDEKELETITEHISDYEIKLFMGTWCGDSKREVPKLFKILQKTGYDMGKITSVAVDYNKSTPANLEEEYNVSMVPTIIFLKDGKEVNRFVEYSIESFEEDLANILKGEKYKNPYAD